MPYTCSFPDPEEDCRLHQEQHHYWVLWWGGGGGGGIMQFVGPLRFSPILPCLDSKLQASIDCGCLQAESRRGSLLGDIEESDEEEAQASNHIAAANLPEASAEACPRNVTAVKR